MIATLNKSKTALSINKQDFKAALSKIGATIDKQIAGLKKPSKATIQQKWHVKSLLRRISSRQLLKVLMKQKTLI